MTSDDNTKRSFYDVIPRSLRLHVRRGCPTCFKPGVIVASNSSGTCRGELG